jgi:hypothetical protein
MSYGWGGNMYGGGFAANPDISKITNLVNVCAQSGSYTFGGNAVQAAIEVYNSLKAKSNSLSIDKGDYAENASKTFDVVYLSGPIDIFYQQSKYSIYIKVLLPPNFPEVAPITSVINIDTNTFTVNKEYKHGLLPDETYAIDLFTASQWGNHKNYNAVIAELGSKLGSVFPFFKATDRTRPQAPRYYPPLVSNFTSPSAGGWNQPGSAFGQFNQQPGQWGSNFNQPQQGYYGNQPQSNFGPNLNHQRPGGPTGSPGPSPAIVSFLDDQVKSLALAVKAELQADKKTVAQLANIRSENMALAEQYKTYNDNLLSQNKKNNDNIKKLTAHKEKLQSLSMDTMIKDGSILNTEDRRTMDVVDTLAQLKATEEADKELQDLFKNGDLNVAFDDVYNMVEKMAKQEFTLKLKIIQLTKV